ncbi:hypothetical protein DFH09DRAFT_1077468 [Mycena vulgaris]|nr:hypothetical protein DFH09DRAFT_1077468 [Mycena vulgaris]
MKISQLLCSPLDTASLPYLDGNLPRESSPLPDITTTHSRGSHLACRSSYYRAYDALPSQSLTAAEELELRRRIEAVKAVKGAVVSCITPVQHLQKTWSQSATLPDSASQVLENGRDFPEKYTEYGNTIICKAPGHNRMYCPQITGIPVMYQDRILGRRAAKLARCSRCKSAGHNRATCDKRKESLRLVSIQRENLIRERRPYPLP